jgi:hypothetical protein
VGVLGYTGGVVKKKGWVDSKKENDGDVDNLVQVVWKQSV